MVFRSTLWRQGQSLRPLSDNSSRESFIKQNILIAIWLAAYAGLASTSTLVAHLIPLARHISLRDHRDRRKHHALSRPRSLAVEGRVAAPWGAGMAAHGLVEPALPDLTPPTQRQVPPGDSRQTQLEPRRSLP